MKKILIGIGITFAVVVLLLIGVSFAPDPNDDAPVAAPSTTSLVATSKAPVTSSTPAVVRTTPAKPAPAATTEESGPSGLGADEVICSMSGANGATYYLDVTSGTEHDLSECDMGKPIKTTLGELMNTENVDRRCVYDPVSDPSVKATVGVYSADDAASRAAAADQCQAHGGTNP